MPGGIQGYRTEDIPSGLALKLSCTRRFPLNPIAPDGMSREHDDNDRMQPNGSIDLPL